MQRGGGIEIGSNTNRANYSPEVTVTEDVEYLKSFESWSKAKVEIVGLVLDTFSGVVKRVV